MDNFIPLYILLLEDETGNVQVLKGDNGKGPLVAQEGDQQELCDIGQGMLDRNLIIGYQLAKTVRFPVRNY